jgi:hypothetical protein
VRIPPQECELHPKGPELLHRDVQRHRSRGPDQVRTISVFLKRARLNECCDFKFLIFISKFIKSTVTVSFYAPHSSDPSTMTNTKLLDDLMRADRVRIGLSSSASLHSYAFFLSLMIDSFPTSRKLFFVFRVLLIVYSFLTASLPSPRPLFLVFTLCS